MLKGVEYSKYPQIFLTKKKEGKTMLTLVNLDDMKKWDGIVKTFINYDVYYLSGYVKAFEIYGEGEPMLFYYEDQEIRAINVVIKRDISKEKSFAELIPINTYFDTITPYGYGGFIIEGKITDYNLKSLDEEYKRFCKKKGIISEIVRFHPVLNNRINLEQIYDILLLGKTVTVKLDSQEQIWNGLSNTSKNRIRKAEKSGVKIYWGRDPKLIDEFIALYNVTMYKNNAKDFYYFTKDFYNSILYDLKYNFMIFYAMYEGKIIAISLILHSNKQLHYHLSGSDIGYLNLAPINLLFYEIACWGYANGFNTFHLGGGLGSKEDSLYKFKCTFNKNSDSTFAIGRKIFDEERYNDLIIIGCKEKEVEGESSFFPAYRK